MKDLDRICETCSISFIVAARKVKYDAKCGKVRGKYCSPACFYKAQTTAQTIECALCAKEFSKQVKEIAKTKNNFCSQSCAATYNNRNKTTGNRRSKLEAYIEQRIRDTYPELEVITNGKVAIGQELDFYFPTLNSAIELNGIFHHQPIYGKEKFRQIKANDKSKIMVCLDKHINLLIHNSYARYNAKTAEEQWLIIKSSIDTWLSPVPRVEVESTTCGV